MGRNGEQRFRKFPDRGNQEVLNVLRSQNHNGIPLSDTLHSIADIFNGGQVGQEHIQFVDGGHRVTDADQSIAHVRENIEQHGIAKTLIGIHKATDTEADEHIIHDIGVTIEILTFRANAHGVDTQTHFPEHILCVQVLLPQVILPEFLFTQLI